MKGEGDAAWFLPVDVDDFMAAAPTDEEAAQVFQQVRGEIEIKGMGEPSRVLSGAVICNHVKRAITCRGYTRVTYSAVLSQPCTRTTPLHPL